MCFYQYFLHFWNQLIQLASLTPVNPNFEMIFFQLPRGDPLNFLIQISLGGPLGATGLPVV